MQFKEQTLKRMTCFETNTRIGEFEWSKIENWINFKHFLGIRHEEKLFEIVNWF